MNKRTYKELRKAASSTSDFLLSPFNPANDLLSVIGSRLTKSTRSENAKALRDMDESKSLSILPLVGSYRLGNRRALLNALLADEDAEHTANSRSTYDTLSKLNPLNILATPIATLLAGITGKRSLQEAKEHADDDNYGLKSMLIPGWNTYNKLKTQGASDRVSKGDYDEDDLNSLPEDIRKAILDTQKDESTESK